MYKDEFNFSLNMDTWYTGMAAWWNGTGRQCLVIYSADLVSTSSDRFNNITKNAHVTVTDIIDNGFTESANIYSSGGASNVKLRRKIIRL